MLAEGGKGWQAWHGTHLHLHEVRLAQGDELCVGLELVHIPSFDQGQAVHGALLLGGTGDTGMKTTPRQQKTTR